ncbi:MAG: aspartate aminotransferase family protein [Chloroflexota bacterium]
MTATTPTPVTLLDDPFALVDTAFQHCIMPLLPVAETREHGPAIYVRGEGVRLTDVHGRTYLDMMSSHTRANSLGYGNVEIADAVREQLATLHYIGTASNLAPTTIRLAEKVASLAPAGLDRALFVNDGSESVETAFKLAKHVQQVSGKPRASKIISRWNAYHGATMGAMSATDWLGIRHISEPGVPGHSMVPGPMCYRNPFGMEQAAYNDLCVTWLEREIQHQGPDYVAAFIAEPVMQAHGVQIPPDDYFARVREVCDRYGVLLIIDEVITGYGRTGKWFASEHWGVQPDIMTMAKALTGGYVPMGGVITRGELVDRLPAFRHVHTFSGHAAAAAAALTAIGIVERDGLIRRGAETGAYLLDGLRQELAGCPIVGDVRGIGMWLAGDFTRDPAAREAFDDDTIPAIVRRMRDYGVLSSPIGTSFELAPPLIASRADAEETVAVAGRAIREIAAERGLA